MRGDPLIDEIDGVKLTDEEVERVKAWKLAEKDLALGPNAEQLAQSPLLSGWVLVRIGEGVSTLHGDVSNHPTIRDCRIVTSPVIGIHYEDGWARTRSRWYRLGQSLVEELEREGIPIISPKEFGKMQ